MLDNSGLLVSLEICKLRVGFRRACDFAEFHFFQSTKHRETPVFVLINNKATNYCATSCFEKSSQGYASLILTQ